jgi:predicted metal-dependent hydrolase
MDDRFQKGLKVFNSRDYFEAHEVWEDLWHDYRETDRTFLQGLIQIAAGLYHLDCGNVRGARSQLLKGLQKLEPYPASHKGVDIPALTSSVNNCLEQLIALEQGEQKSFDLSLLPHIHLR